jgi:GT2 family glycosyltransferase
MIGRESSVEARSSVAVVVPTRNRPMLLRRLLENLEETNLKPEIVVIVDSSDSENFYQLTSQKLHVVTLRSRVCSAAHQRNQGIEYLESIDGSIVFDFVSFLDDDVLVPADYFSRVVETFESHTKFVGISGIALTSEVPSQPKRTWLTDFIGITGNPGRLTPAVVNVSPYGLSDIHEVDWLIGCATWSKLVITRVRFENDFLGQSIFEDVIFSSRARLMGSLAVNPHLELIHELSPVNRESIVSQYSNWVSNRFRIFQYEIPNVSKTRFWILNILLFFHALLWAPFDSRQTRKAKGLILGMGRVLFSRART